MKLIFIQFIFRLNFHWRTLWIFLKHLNHHYGGMISKMKSVSFLISLGFFMIVTNIYNIIPLISFGFVEYDEEDVAPPI